LSGPLFAIDSRRRLGRGDVGLQLLLVARFPNAFAGLPIDGDDVLRSAHYDDITDGDWPGTGNRHDATLDEVVATACKVGLDCRFVGNTCFPARPQVRPATRG